MSIHFVITPYEPTQWETASSDLDIDPGVFQQRFLERWPEAEFQTTPKGGLLWRAPEGESAGFYGQLLSNRQIVMFGPDGWNAFRDFVIWYRAFVPDAYRLFFFNTSSWDSLELTTDTTQTDVDRFVARKGEGENDNSHR